MYAGGRRHGERGSQDCVEPGARGLRGQQGPHDPGRPGLHGDLLVAEGEQAGRPQVVLVRRGVVQEVQEPGEGKL